MLTGCYKPLGNWPQVVGIDLQPNTMELLAVHNHHRCPRAHGFCQNDGGAPVQHARKCRLLDPVCQNDGGAPVQHARRLTGILANR